MIEVFDDFWEYKADIKCITTNGFVKKNGEAVMGRGIAKQAAIKMPQLPAVLGQGLRNHGNNLMCLGWVDNSYWLFNFPVKHNWWEKAELELIKRSAEQLIEGCSATATVLLPRPGCGNGQLAWEEVRPVLEPILAGSRFRIITLP